MQPSPQRKDSAATICARNGRALDAFARLRLVNSQALVKPRRYRGFEGVPRGLRRGNSASVQLSPPRIRPELRNTNSDLMQFAAPIANERIPPADQRMDRAAELTRRRPSISGEARAAKTQEIERRTRASER